MSCVVSVVGICASDDGLKISPSQNAQTPPNDKHDGHGDPFLILKSMIRFNTTAPFLAKQTPYFLVEERRLVYNQDMSKPKIIHKDYSVCSCNYQFRLPLELEVLIPNDDPVRLLNVFVEDMELTDLYQTYGKVKKSQASPRQMFKIIIYAAMNRIYSSRDIESACRRDINFMYLLEGKPAPDHATIVRFISLHLSQCSKKTLAEVAGLLKARGEISGEHIFIDGTKIESAANRYTFVWKKAVTKHQKRLCQKIAVLVEELELLYGIRFIFNGKRFGLRTLKKIRKKLYALKECSCTVKKQATENNR